MVADILLAACAAHGDRVAISADVTALSYRELAVLVRRAGQEAEARQMRRVLLMPGMGSASAAAIYGLMLAGAVPFLGDPSWTDAEVDGIARTNHVDHVVDGRRAAAGGDGLLGLSVATVSRADAPVPGLDPRTVVVRFSSGSTGRPRALQFSAEAVLSAARSWIAGASLGAQDRVLCVATLNNGLAFNTSLLPVFLTGGMLSLQGGPLLPSVILARIRAEQPTIFVGFPLVYELLLQKTGRLVEHFAAIRHMVSSAAPLRSETDSNWHRLVGRRIGHYYGLAEAGPVTFNDGAAADSAGHPLPGVEVRLLPISSGGHRIAVKSGSMALGYIDDGGAALDEAMTPDGFLLTKDSGAFTEGGRLRVGVRLDRVINIAGRKVDPAAIEACLLAVPGVADALVDSLLAGGMPVGLRAYVEGRDISSTLLNDHCRRTLAAGLLPADLVVLPSFPRSAAGKVNIEELRRQLVG